MITATWYRLRADLRNGRRAMVGLVVLLGLFGGLVTATAAGARRTATAYPRLLRAVHTGDVLAGPGGPFTGTAGFYDAVADLPAVRAVGPVVGLQFSRGDQVLPAFGSIDGRFGFTVERPNVLRGRLPRPDRADEVFVNRNLARLHGLAVGDHLDLAIDVQQSEVVPGPHGPVPARHRRPIPVSATVVGIGVFAREVVPLTDLSAEPWMLVPPAITDLAQPEHVAFEAAVIDAAPGSDIAGLLGGIDELARAHADTVGPDGLFTVDLTEQTDAAQESIRPLGVALALFAAVVGLVALVIIGQAVRRHVMAPAAEDAALAAIGSTGRERAVGRLLRGGVLGSLAAAVAVAAAVLSSSRFPIGVAALAEPDRGMRLDGPVLLGGVLAIVLACMLAGASARSAEIKRSRRFTARRAVALPPGPAAGVRAAFGTGGNRGAGPSATITAFVGVLALLAATTFAASLDELIDTPARWGQTWDRMVDAQFGPAPVAMLRTRYRDDPRVRSMAAGFYGEVAIAGERVPAIAWAALAGTPRPAVVEGEMADAPGEIALGGEIMSRRGLEIGDIVGVDAGAGARELRVVGRLVFPRLGLGDFGATGLGAGAQLHPSALTPLSVERLPGDPPGYELEGQLFNFVTFDVVGPPEAMDAELDALAADHEGDYFVRSAQRPTQISDLGRVRSVPGLLAAALAGLALATLVHALVVSVRQRRGELALLKALGFLGRQLSATVAWQATAIVVVGALLGAPAGIAVGRTAWQAFATGFHASAPTVVPLPLVVAVLLAALLLANLVAWMPARAAARVRAAIALRAE